MIGLPEVRMRPCNRKDHVNPNEYARDKILTQRHIDQIFQMKGTRQK